VKPSFHPRVFIEVDAIMKYYEEVADHDLADEFYAEFRMLANMAAKEPGLFRERPGGFKRANLKRFPYNFLFREQNGGIRVLVVRHHARHPFYGTNRK
jgi:plasmid stabilization system protein ParE